MYVSYILYPIYEHTERSRGGRLPVAMFAQRILPTPASLPRERHRFWSIFKCIFSQFAFFSNVFPANWYLHYHTYIYILSSFKTKILSVFILSLIQRRRFWSTNFHSFSLSLLLQLPPVVVYTKLWKHSLTFFLSSPYLHLHSFLFVSRKETSSFVSFSFSPTRDPSADEAGRS